MSLLSLKYGDNCKVSRAPHRHRGPSDRACKGTCDHRLAVSLPAASGWIRSDPEEAQKSSQLFLLSKGQVPQPEVDR